MVRRKLVELVVEVAFVVVEDSELVVDKVLLHHMECPFVVMVKVALVAVVASYQKKLVVEAIGIALVVEQELVRHNHKQQKDHSVVVLVDNWIALNYRLQNLRQLVEEAKVCCSLVVGLKESLEEQRPMEEVPRALLW